MSRPSRNEVERLAQVDPLDVIRSILAESGSLARFMEVHYLASEPELFAIMRVIVGLRHTDRVLLAEFLLNAGQDELRIRRTGKTGLELAVKPGRGGGALNS